MRIESVRIQNLRSFKDDTVFFSNYTCLVGSNGAGKSNVLFALNVFFRESENASTDTSVLVKEDFFQGDTSDPIIITVTFSELSEAAQDEFKEYYRHGKLVVTAKAEFNQASGKAEVKQYGQRMIMPQFRLFFDAQGEKAAAAKLNDIYDSLRGQFGLPVARSAADKADALRAYEAEHPEACQLAMSEDQFYGVSRGADRLGRFVQWVYVPAIKDPNQEQAESKNSALGKLLARTVRQHVNFKEKVDDLVSRMRTEYQQLLDAQQPQLEGLSRSLKTRLEEWAHPDATVRLEWQQEVSKSVKVEEPFAKIIAGEGQFEGELVRMGNGFQRSYLLALLHELSSGTDSDAPKLILGCEEPELFQHPPQARHLAEVLSKLSCNNAQVMVTTHSPYFVNGKDFESVRLARRHGSERQTLVKQLSIEEIAARYKEVTGIDRHDRSGALAKIHQLLQPGLSEMFFTEKLVLVEGLEDLAYIQSWLVLSGQLELFRGTGCHIVPCNNKSHLIRPLIIAQQLGIPVYTLFDADGDKPPQERGRHVTDNKALLRLLGGDADTLFPEATTQTDQYTVWPTNMGKVVDAELEASLGSERYSRLMDQARDEYGQDGSLEKNTLLIGSKLYLAREAGGTPGSLERLCQKLLEFGGRQPLTEHSAEGATSQPTA